MGDPNLLTVVVFMMFVCVLGGEFNLMMVGYGGRPLTDSPSESTLSLILQNNRH